MIWHVGATSASSATSRLRGFSALTAGRERIITNGEAVSTTSAFVASPCQHDDLPVNPDVGVTRPNRRVELVAAQVLIQARTQGKDVSVTTLSSWADAATPTLSTKGATPVRGDSGLTTIAAIAVNGITTRAAFRRAVISCYAGIPATPTGGLSLDHKLAL